MLHKNSVGRLKTLATKVTVFFLVFLFVFQMPLSIALAAEANSATKETNASESAVTIYNAAQPDRSTVFSPELGRYYFTNILH